MFSYPVRVYYSDTDCSGIVYHARYLDFAEHARTEMFRSVGGAQEEMLEQSGVCFVVKSIAIDYLRPGKLDDLLVVESHVEEPKHFSLVIVQEVKRAGEALASLRVKVASINSKTLRPQPLPMDLLSRLREL